MRVYTFTHEGDVRTAWLTVVAKTEVIAWAFARNAIEASFREMSTEEDRAEAFTEAERVKTTLILMDAKDLDEVGGVVHHDLGLDG